MISTIAPKDKFRAVSWRKDDREMALLGDFETSDEAVATCRALYAGGEHDASVFSAIGRCIYVARIDGIPHGMHRPLGVTRLAGLDDPLTRPSSYKRR